MVWILVVLLLAKAGAADLGTAPALGWRPTVLPLLSFSSDEGTGYGIRASLFRYNGSTAPYAAALSAQAFATSGGRAAHRLYLDLPGWRSGERLEIEILYERINYANFYGGLSDRAVEDLLQGGAVGSRRGRTTFRQVYPRLTAMWLRTLAGPWVWRTGAQLGHCQITANGEAGNLLVQLHPLGRDGGLLVMGNIGLRRDSRDDYNDSRRGLFDEILLEYGGGRGGSYRGGRLGLDHRHFLPLPGGLVLAQRLGATLAFGALPFYEYPALGGDDTVRGLLEARERERGRLLANLELRWPGWAPFRGLPMRGGLLFFADAGQSFARGAGPSWRGWRSGLGLGARGHWHGTIARLDLGHSAGRLGVYLKFSQVF